MIYTALLIAAALIATACIASAGEIDDPNLNLELVKRAIRAVENWDGRSVGSAGELGPYQIRPAVWLHHSEKSLNWAYERHPAQTAEQERVASELVEWISARLPGLHLPRTAKSIALVWTCGYGNVQAKQYGRAKKSYAQRVQNIYDDILKTERSHTEAPRPIFAK